MCIWLGTTTELIQPNSVVVKLDDCSTLYLHVNKMRSFIARVHHIGLILQQDFGNRCDYFTATEKCSSRKASYVPVIFKDIKENNIKIIVTEENKCLRNTGN